MNSRTATATEKLFLNNQKKKKKKKENVSRTAKARLAKKEESGLGCSPSVRTCLT